MVRSKCIEHMGMAQVQGSMFEIMVHKHRVKQLVIHNSQSIKLERVSRFGIVEWVRSSSNIGQLVMVLGLQ